MRNASHQTFAVFLATIMLIEIAHGENLFQFLDRFDPSTVSFEQVADKLRGELIERRTMPEFEKWLADVRKNRYVEIVAPELQ